MPITSMEALLAALREAIEEAESNHYDPDDEADPSIEEERFWEGRWAALTLVESFILGETQSLKVGIWVKECTE